MIWLPGVGDVQLPDDIDGVLHTLRNDTRPEKRAAAAYWLGHSSDPRARLALEHAIAFDTGTYDVEGALTDRPERVADTAREALRMLGDGGR